MRRSYFTGEYYVSFNVFTPTFNRAYTLPKVYESLKKQTFRDDEILPNTLERFHYHWNGIPKDQRSQFAGVAGLCVNHKGSIIGSRFPQDIFDSNMWEIRDKHKVTGEKCGFQRTDVMKEFPFPEFEGEKFMTEGIVWYRIAQKYRTRYVSEIFRIYEKLPDGLSVSGLILTIHNPRGTALFWNEYLTRRSSFQKKLKAAVNYISCSLHAKKNIFEVIRNASLPSLAVIAIPVGYLLYLIDRYRYTRRLSQDTRINFIGTT